MKSRDELRPEYDLSKLKGAVRGKILVDPDEGLALRPEIRDRLLTDLNETQNEGENIPLTELARRQRLTR